MGQGLIDIFSSWRGQMLRLSAIFLVASTLLVACSAAVAPAREPLPPVQAGEAAPAAAPAQSEPASVDGSRTSTDDALANVTEAQESRVIIYTGTISLVVRDTREAMEAITSLAQTEGGYVSGSNIYQANDVPRGSITIRVPAEKYQATLNQLRALALRVESENSGTQDVTEEFTDLQARKTNLEVTEKALQELLEERKQVGSTSDILEVYRELTNVRGQIEQIEGRLRYLANQSALSTITIELVPDVLYQPVNVASWQPQGVAKEALQALVAALHGLANVVIWLLIFVLPLVVIFLIPLVVIFWLLRWWWRSRAKKATPPPAPAEEAPQA